jgi:epoxyqueuosine reductase
MTYATFQIQARQKGLVVLGGFHPRHDDLCPAGTGTLLLLGPDPETFWAMLQGAPEVLGSDPVDNWSRRVIGTWACELGAKALFPFGDPLRPFISWALRSERCYISPATLLVHDTYGLMLSFRGALALREHVVLPAPPPSPCATCLDKPCLTTCPVGALGPGYDTDKCHAHLDTPNNDCMSKGCRVRRACPVSPLRPDAQSAHHMRYFHR